MNWFKKLFHKCKHEWFYFDKAFFNDTDMTGNYHEILKCNKCGKLGCGKIIREYNTKRR